MKLNRTRLQITILILLGTISITFVSAPAFSANKFKLKSGVKGKVCLKCHEDFQKILKRRHVHPLLKKGDCSGCHDPHTSSHKNLLTAGPTKLCQNCHKEIISQKSRSTHKVVAEGNCNKCHDSHGSNNRSILAKSGNALCNECHNDLGDKARDARFRHDPMMKENGCISCHQPHMSASSDFLLKKDPPALCLECHKTGKPSFKKKHRNYNVANANCSSCHDSHGSNKKGILYENAHTPVAQNKCTECHQPPTAPNPRETKKRGNGLCRQCHQDMIDTTLDKNRVHWPVLDDTGCLNCHSPHATKQPKLLKGDPKSVCGKCHGDTAELQEWSKSNPKNEKLCEPVKSGNCIACHSPHAADNILLVAQPSMSLDVCGKCHEWQRHSTHPIGEKVFDQRNRNLTLDCMSCHRGCGTGNKPMMLHYDTTYELCIQCHIERRR
jgi:DmsE family decaheme c-type cytochrome